MSTTNSLTTTYSGEFAGEYISAALLSANTIEKGGITVKANVKHKEVIKKISTDDIVKDATCDFDPTSTLTLSERTIEPAYQQVNLQLCKGDFKSDYEAMAMGVSAHHDLPPQFSDFLIAHVAAKVAQKNEQNIWRGVASNNGEYAGLTTLMASDSDVIDVAAASVDSSNVIAQIGAVADAIPNALYGSDDLMIYVSQNVYRAYIRALGGFGASGLGAAGFEDKGTNQAIQPTFFDGIPVFMANGLADNRMVAAEKSNLFFGTGLLSDTQEVKVIDTSDILADDNVRVSMRFTAGVQYGIGSDIVLYS